MTNHDIDMYLMHERLKRFENVTTDQALSRLQVMLKDIRHKISNYKDVSLEERAAGELRLLVHNREEYSNDGPHDDCTHWITAISRGHGACH